MKTEFFRLNEPKSILSKIYIVDKTKYEVDRINLPAKLLLERIKSGIGAKVAATNLIVGKASPTGEGKVQSLFDYSIYAYLLFPTPDWSVKFNLNKQKERWEHLKKIKCVELRIADHPEGLSANSDDDPLLPTPSIVTFKVNERELFRDLLVQKSNSIPMVRERLNPLENKDAVSLIYRCFKEYPEVSTVPTENFIQAFRDNYATAIDSNFGSV